MRFKYLLITISSLLLLSSCSNNDTIIRGPSEPNDNSEEIENPHLVKGITLTKLKEAIETASTTICDITSYKTSISAAFSNIDSLTHQVTSEGPYEIDGYGTLYNNSVLSINFESSNIESYSKLIEYPTNKGYFYVNDAFTEIRLRYFDISDNITKDIRHLDYSPYNYEQTFYPAHLLSLNTIDLNSVSLAGYLNDGRILLQVANASSTSEVIGEETYEVISTKFENYLLKDNKIDEYQKSLKCFYRLSTDDSISFSKISELNSETYAYDDNGDFNKENFPLVS